MNLYFDFHRQEFVIADGGWDQVLDSDTKTQLAIYASQAELQLDKAKKAIKLLSDYRMSRLRRVARESADALNAENDIALLDRSEGVSDVGEHVKNLRQVGRKELVQKFRTAMSKLSKEDRDIYKSLRWV